MHPFKHLLIALFGLLSLAQLAYSQSKPDVRLSDQVGHIDLPAPTIERHFEHDKLYLPPDDPKDNRGFSKFVANLMQHLGFHLHASLALKHYTYSPGGRHLTFEQHYLMPAPNAGSIHAPVAGAFVKVTVDQSGYPTSLVHRLYHLEGDLPDPSKFMHASVNREAAIRQRKVLFPKNGELIPATDTWYTQATPHALIQHITDASGNTLLRRHREMNQADTSGWGYVYLPDPLTPGSHKYGGSFVDNNDATNSTLDAARVERPLLDLAFVNGSYRLQGPYVRLENIDAPLVPQVSSANGSFYYNRSENGFEQVNVYYHIDAMQRYIRSLNFGNLVNWPLRVDAHALSGADNSAYYPNPSNPQQAYVLFGEGGVDDAEDADVIIHEYAHVISDAASPGSNTGFDRRGLDEGYADYFAVSYSRQFNDFEFRKVFHWDGHNPHWPGRTLNDTRNYNPTLFNNFYQLGVHWGTALLDASLITGREVADRIVLQTLYSSFPDMNMIDAAEAVLEADTLLYNGQYSPNFLWVFCDRGLVNDSRCGLASGFEGEPMLEISAPLRVWPNPSLGQIQLELQDTSLKIESVKLYDLAGRQVYVHRPTSDSNGTGFTPELSAGTYLLQVSDQKGEHNTQRIVRY